MAPPSSEEPAAASAEASAAGAISKVLVVIAMQTEALPLVTRFQLVEAAAAMQIEVAASFRWRDGPCWMVGSQPIHVQNEL
ncbi:5'-methylthioadenosine/S-adenosylhomocysteine nucleosidase 1 [Hordeum vulgare]|nr:5'-methylthioadenosine/S-adenosylhomocysteine nucleosidase 1 [Hordeum vulgare]